MWIKIRKMIICFLVIAVICPSCSLAASSTKLPPNGKARIYDNILGWYTIKNGKGEYLMINDEGEYDYTMKYTVVEETSDETAEPGAYIVDDNSYFSIEMGEKRVDYNAGVRIVSRLHKLVVFNTWYADTLEVNGNDVSVTGMENTSCRYGMLTYMPKVKQYYDVNGFVIGKVMLQEEGKKVKLVGAQGNTSIRIYDEKLDFPIAMGRYYFLGGTSYISEKNGKLVATNAVPLSDYKTKGPTMLYVRPINKGKNLLLTWNRIKGAKSYIVYKYDYKAKKYKRYDILDGNGRNYCNIPGVDDSSTYKFVIRAKSKLDGKGKFVGKRSYAVWSVGKNNPSKGNATSVVINKKALKGKKGKSVSLKAKVYNSEGKEILSNSVRWYSTNKKVATAGTFTGKIKFRKKGTCYIYAKAHNGKNSKKIKVTVK